MKPKEYAAVIATLEKIDRTSKAPTLSGPIGRFFRAYAEHRLSATKLSVEMGITPRKDGTLPGGDLGVATLRFLDDVVTWDQTETEFGVLYHVPALCEEFLSPVTLRLWSTTGPGAEGIQNLDGRRLRAQGIRLSGNFLWKPPGVLLPNEAALELIDIPEDPQWLGADYLRYVAEDISIDPHPLSYIPFATARSRTFAALRVVGGVPESAETLVIPYATKEGLAKVPIRVDATSNPLVDSLIAERSPGLWLIAREPQDEVSIVLDARKATHEDLVLHSVTWSEHLRSLNDEASVPAGTQITEQTLANLRLMGFADSLEVQPATVQRHANPLAVRLSEQMRFPSRRVGTRVLRG